MNKSRKFLSDFVVYAKYAKHLPNKARRESWEEICFRYEDMMSKRVPEKYMSTFITAMTYVRDKKILPSMRALQFAGKAIEKNEARLYNCCYMPVDDHRAFSEAMFLLLSGAGVGYSVQKQHIKKLPKIYDKKQPRVKYLIGDSIEGWADAIKALIKAHLGLLDYFPAFDASDIRHKGMRLITSGGKAPGPDPLMNCLKNINNLFMKKIEREDYTLRSIDCHDIMCYIADAVLAGGIRRAAMISLFSYDDEEMLNCKSGEWCINNSQRSRANNTVVLHRDKITLEQFEVIWKKIKQSKAGEPGIYWTHNEELGINPCGEISLKSFQFCNLTEVNVSDIETTGELVLRSRLAAFLGTLQASFTNFHFLRPIWKETTEKDALIGVGLTGIASGNVLSPKIDVALAAKEAIEMNVELSVALGISRASRVTTVKPSGTSSLVLGTSSGIHAWFAPYYVRRIRISKQDPIFEYLKIMDFPFLNDDEMRPAEDAVISIPIEAPQNAIFRYETEIDFLERVKKFYYEWIRTGHVDGDNTNNVSATVYVKDDKWKLVGDYVYNNNGSFNGLSVLPYDDSSYVQMPFEEITQETFEDMMSKMPSNIDFTKIVEIDANIDRISEPACSGGACEIT